MSNDAQSLNYRSEASIVAKCVRAAQIVASVWTLAGSLVLAYAISTETSTKVKVLGLGCLLVAGAMYSVILPIWIIIKKSPHGRDL